jgi:hypothetical protein
MVVCMPDYPDRCNATTSMGSRCFTRVVGGGPCAVHRHHGERAPQAFKAVRRCEYVEPKTRGRCFVAIGAYQVLCDQHVAVSGVHGLQREARALRRALDNLDEAIAQLAANTPRE